MTETRYCAWNYPLPLLIKWHTHENSSDNRLELSSSSSDKMGSTIAHIPRLLGIILFLF
ncbi:Uncharacterised protein [Scardovia inopinata]|uniref:Uncharacterized protein n=1 Tax=Scardovia inopinata F0304 TaxID=641146 RepID=W1MXC6_SCAIO|nr:hypothetical protein HMPREF9020_01493 [Scardovia inopinata F0304]SUV51947.1 Uncharacterised protein [Scardovia inopinata]